ncbi:MAG: PLP-dependent aminotransferase family protein [Coriobacteriales bacterium]|jgi:GntR family transcriptional regulator/MocR family aminotransferase|nr:PLP-dependent aminotransferase family protein [Coriobacteriales bacterium]
MMITLDHSSPKPLYQQIYEQLRAHIMDGSYRVGSRLPSIRHLATELGVARNTVDAAYLQLTQEGYVSSRAGSGFMVEALELMSEASPAQQRDASQNFIRRLSQTALWDAPATNDDGADTLNTNGESDDADGARSRPSINYDFTYGNLQDGSFPSQLWRRLVAEVLSGQDAYRASVYANRLGEPGLREQIARALHAEGGVNCHPAQVVVQAGTQAALYNLLTLFDPLRDVIAMEEPGYDGARSVFANARFRVFPLPVYEGNEAFIEALYDSRARLAYVTPSNQFPTGKILQMGARQRLLKWASSTNAYIVEDDYCREFRYTSRPLPSLQSLDRDERVIYMGTFSKALSPALRMSYLVLPPDLLFQWNALFENHYPEVPWLSQAVLQSYMEKGYWEKHLRKAQTRNRRKYQSLVNALQKYMGKRVDVMENGSGLHLLVGVLDKRHQNDLIDKAREAGVRVYGTRRYWMSNNHPLQNYVLIGFSAISEEKIEPGIARLAHAWFG